LEKGAAAAAEYLSKTYPDAKGFYPRDFHRMGSSGKTMREFQRGHERGHGYRLDEECGYPEGCEDLEEKAWYIQAVRRFGWTKAELLEQIHAKAYLEALDFADAVCYTEENAKAKETPAMPLSRVHRAMEPEALVQESGFQNGFGTSCL